MMNNQNTDPSLQLCANHLFDMINRKLSELNAYEERLKKKELELERRERDLEKLILSNNSQSSPIISENNILNNLSSLDATITTRVFNVTEFDTEYTSNKLKVLNDNRTVQKIYNDDWPCACLGLIPDHIIDSNNFDIVRFQTKFTNNCWNNLFVGYAFKDDFYLSGKNYSVCSYMICLHKLDNEIKIYKYWPENESGSEIENYYFGTNIQTLEMIHNKVEGKISLIINGQPNTLFKDELLKSTLHPAFELSQYQATCELI